jgi:alpha-galactosidase
VAGRRHLPLPGNAQTVRSYTGQWANEFLLQTDALSRSLWQRENRRGRTSHDCFPGAVVTTPGSTEHAGLVYGAHLAWSGNHQQTIEWLHDGQYQWQLGEWLAPGEVRWRPASACNAQLLASCSTQGPQRPGRQLPRRAAQRMPWPGGRMRPRPVHLNTWEGFYFDHRTDEGDRELAEAAAAWAWSVCARRRLVPRPPPRPRRAGRLVARPRQIPRRPATPGSPCEPAGHGVRPVGGARDGQPRQRALPLHPDWALQLEGRPLITARNQLVLDIARPEAADYLFDKLSTRC